MMPCMSTPYDPYRPPSAPLDGPRPADGSPGVSDRVVAILVQTRPWLKLLTVLFIVGLALGLVAAFALGALAPGRTTVRAQTVIPLVVILLLYLPGIVFLWRYAASITRLQQGGGPAALEEALTSQKSFWKYLGILAVVFLCFYAVALPVGYFAGRALRH
jgi:amino acid transporter